MDFIKGTCHFLPHLRLTSSPEDGQSGTSQKKNEFHLETTYCKRMFHCNPSNEDIKYYDT